MRFLMIRSYKFEAAHHLALPDGHKCARLHGHNYQVEITLEVFKGLNGGMVVEASVVDNFFKPILAKLDHRCLNEVEDISGAPADAMRANPTAENIAAYLFWRLKPLENGCMAIPRRVTVWENDTLAAVVEES